MVNADCPLCFRGYSQLSQHLVVSHRVKNKDERKLLLAIPSRRADVRKGNCPLPACGKFASRMDHHSSHTEITAAARQQTIETLKQKKIREGLARLRASNLAMASMLDLQEVGDLEDPTYALEEEAVAKEEEERPCENPRSRKARDE